MPKIPPPKGTRDLYPLEAARRRWLSERWRRVAIRHGFEEVDGPTFETTDLYAVKSGEGILGELFQAYSGKDPRDIERIRGGEAAPFAMRPEFTPSLARMYAERARTLPSPCKWFQIGPFFRAERPQRGRLREFLQWNVDVLGLEGGFTTEGTENTEAKARMDAELIACCAGFLKEVGLSSDDVKIHVNDRMMLEEVMRESGVPDVQFDPILAHLDRIGKIPKERWEEEAKALGCPVSLIAWISGEVTAPSTMEQRHESMTHAATTSFRSMDMLRSTLFPLLSDHGLDDDWVFQDVRIVRGLAYYTGTVFEVIADGERAVAGGGRYDNLIELFGGPATPAVGFAMGDVGISLLLQDKGLMPSDTELMEEIGARPDVFVISTYEDLDPLATRLLAMLRREGLHARRSYRATRNEKKLLGEASRPPHNARVAIILDSPTQVTVKDLDAAIQQTVDQTVDIGPGFDDLLTLLAQHHAPRP